MCWYSQHERIDTRRAIEGEELIVRDFPAHGRWLASADDPGTPVCIPNGCKLRLTNIPRNLQKELKVGPEVVAEFREIHQRQPQSLLAKIFLPPRLSFDVLLFPTGRSLEVSMLSFEVKVDVLSSAVASPVPPAEEIEIERIYVDR